MKLLLRVTKSLLGYLNNKVSLIKASLLFLVTTTTLIGFQLIYYFDIDQKDLFINSSFENNSLHTIVFIPRKSVIIPKQALNYIFETETIASYPSLDQYKNNLLLNKPFFKDIHTSFIGPGFVSIEYTLKEVIAKIGNLQNMLMTTDGALIPESPIFSPSNLTTLYLDTKNLTSDTKYTPAAQFKLYKHIQKFIKKMITSTFRIISIDTSQYNLDNPMNREVIIKMEDFLETTKQGEPIVKVIPIYARLNPSFLEDGLEKLIRLLEKIRPNLVEISEENSPKELIIDLRIIDQITIN